MNSGTNIKDYKASSDIKIDLKILDEVDHTL